LYIVDCSLKDLIKLEGSVILLVDAPGMGKSSLATKFVDELRQTKLLSRMIIQINLSEHEDTLDEYKKLDDFDYLDFVSKSVGLDHLKSLLSQSEDLEMYVVIDGLDEVCPKHEVTAIRLLKSFLHDKTRENVHLKKLFVTTRPHLKTCIQDELLRVNIVFSLTLKKDDQMWFLKKSLLNVSEVQIKSTLDSISPSLRELLENPLMLFLFTEIIISHGSMKLTTDLNLFDLYERFIQAKHKRHVKEKQGLNPDTKQSASSLPKDLWEVIKYTVDTVRYGTV